MYTFRQRQRPIGMHAMRYWAIIPNPDLTEALTLPLSLTYCKYLG